MAERQKGSTGLWSGDVIVSQYGNDHPRPTNTERKYHLRPMTRQNWWIWFFIQCAMSIGMAIIALILSFLHMGASNNWLPFRAV